MMLSFCWAYVPPQGGGSDKFARLIVESLTLWTLWCRTCCL